MPSIGTTYLGAENEPREVCEAKALAALQVTRTTYDEKIKAAQQDKFDKFETPAKPGNKDEALALGILVAKGPQRADQVAKFARTTEDTAMKSLRGLVDADKASWTITGDGVVYALKQKVTKVDSPYKGKTLTWGQIKVTYQERRMPNDLNPATPRQVVNVTQEYTLA